MTSTNVERVEGLLCYLAKSKCPVSRAAAEGKRWRRRERERGSGGKGLSDHLICWHDDEEGEKVKGRRSSEMVLDFSLDGRVRNGLCSLSRVHSVAALS